LQHRILRTVQEGDPHPLANTVSMTCGAQVFPNVLDGSDGHSTSLFQPAVEIIKTRPAVVTRGEMITYSLTINTLRSDDSPNLILDSVSDINGNGPADADSHSCSCSASTNEWVYVSPTTRPSACNSTARTWLPVEGWLAGLPFTPG
jgi:hypothetical protein